MQKNLLDSVSFFTKIVVDSSDFKSLGNYKSADATTNPSLIIKSLNNPKYQGFIKNVANQYNGYKNEDLAREVVISFAEEILKVIPGRVSVEVDPLLAFDTKKTELETLKIIESCQLRTIPLERILIKIPATWEGILAAKSLEKKNIKCNLTLLFSEIQALYCAEYGVTMISPFVGRISDWWRKKGFTWQTITDDPGVKFARSVYFFFKEKGYSTEVMAASFRSIEQITSLTGLDLLTINPNLLLKMLEMPPKENLTSWIKDSKLEKCLGFIAFDKNLTINHAGFLKSVGANKMANENLTEGINIFKKDGLKLTEAVKNNF